MYFGSIVKKESGVETSYTYMRRGTKIPFFPDLHKENEVSEGYISLVEGNLFNKKVIGWKWLSVFDIGVDIVINFNRSCFIDEIIINQSNESAIKSVTVLCSNEEGQFTCKGKLDAATGSVLNDDRLEVALGVSTRNLIIRLDACFKDIIIEDIDIIGAVFDKHIIYPFPTSINIDNSALHMDIFDLDQISINTSSCSNPANNLRNDIANNINFAANLLKEKLYENFKLNLPIVHSSIKKTNEIVLNINTQLPTESYSINVNENLVQVEGADKRGLIYGVEALLMLINDEKIPSCTVNDSPFMGIRGVHFGLPPREEIPFIKRLIRYVFAPMGYNTIFLEIAGGMRFDKHPKINEVWEEGNKKAKAGIWPPFPHGTMVSGGEVLEKFEVADLVDYARSYGIEVIPEIQSLGHVQYLTMAYPEVAETEFEIEAKDKSNIDLKKEDAPPDKFYKDSYCPSNEKSYSIMFDLIDEIVEVVRPTEYVHMGHDEVYTMGTCPLCKDKDHSDLYASDVNKLYNYLASKNLKMMIWGDMLHNVTKYKTPPAINKIPKDIVLLDFIWYFHLDKDIEDHLLNHGFNVIMGNMYSSHYPRFEKRARKKGMLGAQVSTWKRMDEYNMGFEGKIYDFIYSANMMWSSSYRSDLRLSIDHIVSKIMPRIRSQIHGKLYPSLSKTKNCVPIPLETQYSDNIENVSHISSYYNVTQVPCDLLAALPNQGKYHNLNGIPFIIDMPQVVISEVSSMGQIPETLTIPVGHTFDSLLFLHTARENVERIAWQDPVEIGSYIIKYEDNTKFEVPIEYGANIGVWYKRYGEPLKHPYYRHQGYISTYFADAYIQSKTPNGKNVTIYGYEWINPFKDKAIVSVTLAAKGNTDAAVMLFAITGIK